MPEAEAACDVDDVGYLFVDDVYMGAFALGGKTDGEAGDDTDLARAESPSKLTH